MPIQFTCPHCFKKTLIDDKYAGQQGPCASCGKTISIPELQSRDGRVTFGGSPGSSTSQTATAVYMPATKSAGRSQYGKPIVALAVAMVLGLLLYGGWTAAAKLSSSSIVRQLQERKDRVQCMNHIHEIVRALNLYAANHGGQYPPAISFDDHGNPMHSWRVLILQELGEHNLYSQYRFDEPWDSKHNSDLLASNCPDVFKSPARDDYAYTTNTSYFLVIGDGTIFPKDSKPLGPKEIADGLNSTLLVVEADNQNHPWYKPIDIEARDWSGATGSIAIGGTHPGGFTAGFADGQPAWIPDSTPPETIRKLITPTGGEKVDSIPFLNP